MSAERVGATRTTTIGATMLAVEASAKTTKARTASAVETFALRISTAAAIVSEYVRKSAPATTASSQFVRSRRSSNFGGAVSDEWSARRRKARAETSRTMQPRAISIADARREGVVLCELKSWP